MKPLKCYNKLLAEKIIEELKKRNMDGFYCLTRQDALKKVLELIPKDSFISCGGSATLRETGILDELKMEGYNLLDPAEPEGGKAKDEAAHKALGADYFLMSTNAITASGELVNIDGYGNRVSALIFGPKNVIVVAGMNKAAPDLESAIARVKQYSAPNTLLLFKQDYTSYDELCKAAEAACSQLVVTSFSTVKGRIKVVLVDEGLGF